MSRLFYKKESKLKKIFKFGCILLIALVVIAVCIRKGESGNPIKKKCIFISRSSLAWYTDFCFFTDERNGNVWLGGREKQLVRAILNEIENYKKEGK